MVPTMCPVGLKKYLFDKMQVCAGTYDGSHGERSWLRHDSNGVFQLGLCEQSNAS